MNYKDTKYKERVLLKGGSLFCLLQKVYEFLGNRRFYAVLRQFRGKKEFYCTFKNILKVLSESLFIAKDFSSPVGCLS